jgi:hypothetical protein
MRVGSPAPLYPEGGRFSTGRALEDVRKVQCFGLRLGLVGACCHMVRPGVCREKYASIHRCIHTWGKRGEQWNTKAAYRYISVENGESDFSRLGAIEISAVECRSLGLETSPRWRHRAEATRHWWVASSAAEEEG